MKIAAERRAAKRLADAELQAKFLSEWNTWTDVDSGDTYELPGEWRVQIGRFIAAGLELDDLTELVDVAMTARCRDVWRYFCGCCWRRLAEAQETARSVIETMPREDDEHHG